MGYGFEGDHQKYLDSIREFVYGELEVLAEEMEETGKYPPALWDKLRERDIFRLAVPEKYGGLGFSDSEYFPIVEEISKSHGGIRLLVHGWNGICLHPLMHYGRQEQKDKYLPMIARGEWFSAFALTEPGTGSGADVKMEARRNGDNYVLNGTKHMISYADVANCFNVFTYTDRSLGNKGMTCFIVERDNPGLEIAYMEAMGLHGSPHGRLVFKDCLVPEESVLGEVGQGLDIAMGVLPHSRLSISVSCLGPAQRLLELSIDYAKKKVSFGKVIAQRQAVQGMLADMATSVYAARTMIYDTIRLSDLGENMEKEAAMCKLFAAEMVRRVSDQAIEVHGGLGYFQGLPVERIYRDCRSLFFEEGTPTIQRAIISGKLLR